MSPRYEVGSRVYSSQYGAGEVTAAEGTGDAEKLTIQFDRAGSRQIMPAFSMLEPLDHLENAEQPSEAAASRDFGPGEASLERMKEALREVLREESVGSMSGETLMLERWRGGRLILKPSREGQKEKELPIEDFFHKIVMLRDRLRVLEQKINAHRGLSDADKVELQQYITRIYGTLTSFNVLFADRGDWFVGQKGEDAP